MIRFFFSIYWEIKTDKKCNTIRVNEISAFVLLGRVPQCSVPLLKSRSANHQFPHLATRHSLQVGNSPQVKNQCSRGLKK